jgi:hypothetical protein
LARLQTLMEVVVPYLMYPYSPTQFESALRPGIKTVWHASASVNLVRTLLTNLGQRIIGLVQQHWPP